MGLASYRRWLFAVVLSMASLGGTGTVEAQDAFVYDDFGSIGGLVLVQDAAQAGSAVRLVPDQTNKRGAVWYGMRVHVGRGFSTVFAVRFTSAWDVYSDGMAFVVQDYAGDTIGRTDHGGSGLGYHGIPRSVAVEIDLHRDDSGQPAQHVAVHSLGQAPNTDEGVACRGWAEPGTDLEDEEVHEIAVQYDAIRSELAVSVDGAHRLTVPFDVAEIGAAEGWAWVGFTAATGAGTANHDVLAWRFLPFPRWPTQTYTIGRSGLVSEQVVLRGYLRRVVDGAWLAGRPIAFSIDGTEVGSGLTTSSGRADLPWTITDGPATRTILAEFAGDAAYLPSSGTGTLTALTTDTKMIGYDRAGRITEYTTLRAMLYRPDNTPVRGKTVNFVIDGTPAVSAPTNVNGRALVGYVIPDAGGAGARTIVADWPGDGGYRASSATSTLYVGKALPYLWLLPKSCPVGGAVGLYAYFRRLDDYQKQEGKTVSFKIDGTWVADVITGTGADAGIARYTYQTVEPFGTHTIRCEFAGDACVDAGYGEATLTIY